MAFTAEKLAVNESGNTNGGGFHQYKDVTLTLPALSAAGYFNDAFALKDGDMLLLTGIDGLALKTIDITSGVVSLIPTNITGHAQKQVLLTLATYSPTVEQNGSTFIFQRATGVTVTLPAPLNGLNYRFIHGGAVSSSNGHVIKTSALAEIAVGSHCSGGVIALMEATSDTITFVNTTSILGDYIDIESDGTYWYANGLGSTTQAVLISNEAA